MVCELGNEKRRRIEKFQCRIYLAEDLDSVFKFSVPGWWSQHARMDAPIHQKQGGFISPHKVKFSRPSKMNRWFAMKFRIPKNFSNIFTLGSVIFLSTLRTTSGHVSMQCAQKYPHEQSVINVLHIYTCCKTKHGAPECYLILQYM